jgi:hypothetical protein
LSFSGLVWASPTPGLLFWLDFIGIEIAIGFGIAFNAMPISIAIPI